MHPELHHNIRNKYLEDTNIHAIGYGKKITNGMSTSNLGVIFHVFKKKPISELQSHEIIPANIEIDNENYITDVIEEPELPKFIGCYDWSPGQKVIDGCPPDDLPNELSCYKDGLMASAEQNAHRSELRPIVGGISITEYSKNAGSIGTMGLLVRDNEDNSIVALTNSHVVTRCTQDPLQRSRFFTENHRDSPVVQPAHYETWDGTPGSLPSDPLSKKIGQVKRSNFFTAGLLSVFGGYTLYIDAALVHLDPGIIDASSANIKGFEYFGPMSFATTEEINRLLDNNNSLYISGRTTGAKGGINCRISVKEMMYYIQLSQQRCSYTYWSTINISFYDILKIEYDSGNYGVVVPGDSGSIVVGDFAGTKKVVGLVFAAGGDNYKQGFFCRIDRVAAEMNISAWDGTNIIHSNPADWQYISKDIILQDPESLPPTESINVITEGGKKYWRIGSVPMS